MKLQLFKNIFRRKTRDSQSVVDFESIDDLKKTLETGIARTSITSSCVESGLSKTSVDELDELISENVDFVVVDWKLPSFDEATTNIQTMEAEMERLLILRSFHLLETKREDHFDRIVQLAAEIFHAPIALISLVDLGRQWFLSSHGLDASVTETPRNLSVCAHVVQGKTNRPLVIPDLSKDFRFKDNPLVTGPLALRFYAGAPLISPEGMKLGSFCVIDFVARPEGLNFFEEEILTDLANMTMKIMVERRSKLHSLQASANKSTKDTSTMIECFDRMICPITDMKKLYTNLNNYIEPLPKPVPITIEFAKSIANTTHIEADDLLLFRCSLILMNNAVSRTKAGSITFCVSVVKNDLLFECIDTGLPSTYETKTEFGDVGSQFSIVQSMVHKMGGEYGIKNNGVGKTNVWFSIPFNLVDVYMGNSKNNIEDTVASTCTLPISMLHIANLTIDEPDADSNEKKYIMNKLKYGSIAQNNPFHQDLLSPNVCTSIASTIIPTKSAIPTTITINPNESVSVD